MKRLRSVGRDPFARGEYEVMGGHPPGECSWCGSQKERLKTFIWVGDAQRSSTDKDHSRAKKFCSFGCFQDFHS